MIDLHCHVLPGVDDGPPALADTLELASVSAAEGTGLIVATPHVDHSWDNDSAKIARGVDAVNAALRAEGLPIEVTTGAEVAATRAMELDGEELHALHLGGGPYLLLESPLNPTAGDIDQLVFALQLQGHRILLAHPERSPLFLRRPERLRALVERDVLCSITAGSITGRFGQTVRRFTIEMLREDIVHNVASDAHDIHRRPPGLRAGIAAAESHVRGISARTAWFTEEMPAAILSGDPLPEPPALPARRSLRDRLAGRRGR